MLGVAVTGGLRDGAKRSGRAAAPRAYWRNVLPAFRRCARSGYVPSVPGFFFLGMRRWQMNPATQIPITGIRTKW